MKLVLLSVAILAGATITIQSVLNAALGERTGTLGSVLILTVVSILLLLIPILIFPSAATFTDVPKPGQWYLYLGGALSIAILAAPIFLIPRIGVAATLTGIVLGQLLLPILVDHFGMFGAPRVTLTPLKMLGAFLMMFGAYFVTKS